MGDLAGNYVYKGHVRVAKKIRASLFGLFHASGAQHVSRENIKQQKSEIFNSSKHDKLSFSRRF